MFIILTEPLQLSVGKEYNLNNIKVIEVTKHFLTLDQRITGCQNKMSSGDCKTLQFINTLLEQCECVPYSIKQEGQVGLLTLILLPEAFFGTWHDFVSLIVQR